MSKTQYLKNKKKTHVGYFLLEDKNSLYKNLGTNLKELSKKQKANLYIQSNLGISLFLTILFSILMYYKTLNISVAIIVGLFSFIPTTQIAMKLIDYILLKITKPTLIPKMDYHNGINIEAPTFVVIPTIITNTKKVEELAHKLEIYYLANKSNNLYFAILGDVTCRKK